MSTQYMANLRSMVEAYQFLNETEELLDELEEVGASGNIQDMKKMYSKLNKYYGEATQLTSKRHELTKSHLEHLMNGGSFVEDYMDETKEFLLQDTEFLRNLKTALDNVSTGEPGTREVEMSILPTDENSGS